MEEYIFKEKNDQTSLIFYLPNFINTDWYLKNLNAIENNQWKGGFAFGREIPRLQRWYSKTNQYFYPKWHLKYERWEPQSYENWLELLQQKVQNKLDNIFDKYYKIYNSFVPFNVNSAQINYYRNENDMIPQHRDHLQTFGKNPSIAILSIGATRKMAFERIEPDLHNIKPIKNETGLNIKLENGSLLIMAGTTQTYFSHGIPKEKIPCDKRYSITFRNHVQI